MYTHAHMCTEEFPLQCTSPYGRTKFFIEEMLRDVATADPEWKVMQCSSSSSSSSSS